MATNNDAARRLFFAQSESGSNGMRESRGVEQAELNNVARRQCDFAARSLASSC